MKTVLVVDLRTLIGLGLISLVILFVIGCYAYDALREWRRRRSKRP